MPQCHQQQPTLLPRPPANSVARQTHHIQQHHQHRGVEETAPQDTRTRPPPMPDPRTLLHRPRDAGGSHHQHRVRRSALGRGQRAKRLPPVQRPQGITGSRRSTSRQTTTHQPAHTRTTSRTPVVSLTQRVPSTADNHNERTSTWPLNINSNTGGTRSPTTTVTNSIKPSAPTRSPSGTPELPNPPSTSSTAPTAPSPRACTNWATNRASPTAGHLTSKTSSPNTGGSTPPRPTPLCRQGAVSHPLGTHDRRVREVA